jgi:phage gpG-like protein
MAYQIEGETTEELIRQFFVSAENAKDDFFALAQKPDILNVKLKSNGKTLLEFHNKMNERIEKNRKVF